MADADHTAALQAQVRDAAAAGRALCLRGSGSKDFYGRAPAGEPLALAGHRGILHYAPTELVLTARAGTPLIEVETALAAERQMLAFEPPHFGPGATLGGTLACGLSGPRRPYAGAARDHLLGVRLLNGRGEVLRFGGEVMKNVAGYDVSRLMVGALGTLGALLEVSVKVLPMPETELTLRRPCSATEALRLMNLWAGRPLPLSAAMFDGDALYLRLSGASSAVAAARAQLGGEPLPASSPEQDPTEELWTRLREHRHGFFQSRRPLWRLSVPPTAPLLEGLPGKWLLDWAGAQRWLVSEAPAAEIRRAAAGIGGHATLFRHGDRDGEVFQPLAPEITRLHHNLKQAFDPAGLFNPGRLYPDL